MQMTDSDFTLNDWRRRRRSLVPGSEKFQGTNVTGSESSRERIGQGPTGAFAPGSELARERKGCDSIQLGCQSTRHMVNSSPGQLVKQSTRHKEAVNSSQANKQANIKAVLPQQYNYRCPRSRSLKNTQEIEQKTK